MLEPITYKQVLDKTGAFTALELWQGDQHVTISLAAEGTHRNHHRWSEVKDIIDGIQAKVRADVLKSVEFSI